MKVNDAESLGSLTIDGLCALSCVRVGVLGWELYGHA